MHLSELKLIHVSELIKMGEALEIENVARMRKQELMFAIMKKRAKGGEQVFGDGVLEVLPDGFGFLRSPRHQLHGVDRRHLSLAEPGAALQPAHRRHGRGRGPGAEGRRALLRPGQGRQGQRPDSRGEQAQDHVREPDAALPEGAVQSSSATSSATRTSPAASSTSSRRSAKASARCSSRRPRAARR